ncbi:NAD-dependent epimerase/dehydratase [Candidatus Magnetobacterium bavaricum]|uniref:NAD-dependent epimerase/dehydratase n=1 Tax=Candidatus Magnetobacterium bavaricum TaxID=29290 RepID=A0A0F3GHC0_9BACT|nr:NAD-dependent epimerase/dehydratase [Candidatus Magnetobacterium bavaricum]
MKAVVFGGSGFLGSHVASVLTDAGYNVIIYDLVKSKYLRPTQEMIVDDILNGKKIDEVVKDSDVVYNFAAIADLDNSVQNPLDTVKINIIGNTIILEACRKFNVKRFVFASSLYVYSKSGSFYRSTKQACELLIENYYELFGLTYTILRYGSLYGPRADERNFIHKIIKQALTDKIIVREGDGYEIREYIHIYDAARMSVTILDKSFENQSVIITGVQQIKVRDLLIMIKEMLDNKVEIKYVTPKHNIHYEITPYCFSPKLANRIVSNTYIDLGQGIFECIKEIYNEQYKC